MSMKKKGLLIIGLVLLLLITTTPALAQGPKSEAGRVVFGANLTLDESDFVDGDVVVFGGNFTMEEGSEVDGDVVVFGGRATINGEVKGDVAVIGGTVEVQSEAYIKGDVASLGGTVTVDESAEVSGSVTKGPDLKFGEGGVSIHLPTQPASSGGVPEVRPEATAPTAPTPPAPPERPHVAEKVVPGERRSGSNFVQQVGTFIGDGIQDIFMALVLAGLGVLVVMFFPAHTKIVQQTLTEATPVSFVLGLVTLIASGVLLTVLGVLFFLIIPICGIILVAVALTAAFLLGISVIGKFVGARIFSIANNPSASDVSATLLGVAVLILIIRMPFVDHLPWIGWMFGLTGWLIGVLTASTAVGAVVLSRFGTQPYRTHVVPATPAPPSPPTLPEQTPIVPPAPEETVIEPELPADAPEAEEPPAE